MAQVEFAETGAAHFPAAFSSAALDRLCSFDCNGPGQRLTGAELRDAIAPATAIACDLLDAPAFAVRAVLFDKTTEHNWAVAWHQDRTIAVRKKSEIEGFGPWTIKQGIVHVAPPIGVLETMVTLRIHLDECGADNAPLKAALGSHRLGRVPAAEAAAVASRLPVLTCGAASGDVWAYATPILHASDRAANPTRRRVLQVDFSARPLPAPLEWLGLEH